MKHIQSIKYFLLGLTAMGFMACGGDDESPEPPEEVVEEPAFTVTPDPATTYQTIDGFGGANGIFNNSLNPTASDAQKAFGTGSGDLGLSIFRIKIPYNQSDWQALIAPAQEALKYNVKIIASPWSPPPALKNNNDPVRGYLLESNYGEYVDHLNAFVDFMETNGVDLYAISIQNEPDWEATYESCDWTADQMVTFLADYGDQIDDRVLVAAPESLNFSDDFTNAILSNNESAQNMDIAAGHLYGGGLGPFPIAEQKGKAIWMTEYLLNLNVGDWRGADESTKWEETLTMLNSIHESMGYNWNAYIWWYLKRYYSFIGDGEQGTTRGLILKRGYAFSHYSYFIRPGYTRIGLQGNSSSLRMTAYEGDGKVIIVAINPGASTVSDVGISLPSGLTSATSYTTTLTSDRVEASPEVEEGLIMVDILPRSVVTFVLE
ncbi:hypothetical protein AB9P05_24450 [Roseivirga sp. BDSF3-8]|uniref:hypothetical protein n=1 Tax=Roseivirga sp. BDSF3-8 TaxID=3241598 RepID=UPI003532033A